MKFSILRDALPAAQQALSDHPDVRAVGIGEKRSKGKNTRKYAIVVFVERKKKNILDRAAIPKSLHLPNGRFLTDVRELPALSFRPTNARIDGSDLIFATEIGQFGTLGVVGKERKGEKRVFGITNAHVVTQHDANGVGAKISAGTPSGLKKIGSVTYHTTLSTSALNTTDVALIKLNSLGIQLARKNAIETVQGKVSQTVPLSATTSAGGQRPHFYVTEEEGVGKVRVPVSVFTELDETYYVDPITNRKVKFGRAFHCEAGGTGVKEGHSGSVLLRIDQNDDLVATGILFAGRDGDAFVFSWTEIDASFKSFGVEF